MQNQENWIQMSSVINLLHGDLPMAGLLAWPSSSSKNTLIILNHYFYSIVVLAEGALFSSTLQLVYKLRMGCFPFCCCHNTKWQLAYNLGHGSEMCWPHSFGRLKFCKGVQLNAKMNPMCYEMLSSHKLNELNRMNIFKVFVFSHGWIKKKGSIYVF